MQATVKSINDLKITTGDDGRSIITAARNLLKAGARENKKKRSIAEEPGGMFLDADKSEVLTPPVEE